MRFSITQEQLQSLYNYLDGDIRDGSSIPFEVINELRALDISLQKKMQGDLEILRKANVALRMKVDRLETAENVRTAKGEFQSLFFKESELVRAVVHCLNHLKSKDGTEVRWKGNNGRKVMAIAFDVWAVWLGSQKQLLTTDLPQTYLYGPWFWSAANACFVKGIDKEGKPYFTVNVTDDQAKDAWDAIASENKGVCAVIRNVVQKYAFLTLEEIENEMKKCPAYSKAVPKKDSDGNVVGKWSVNLDPTEVWKWKNHGKSLDPKPKSGPAPGEKLSLSALINEES